MSPNTCSGCRGRSRVKRVSTNYGRSVPCTLAASEQGPRAIPRLSAARRGGRYPRRAHDVAVAAARRLRCDARPTRAAACPGACKRQVVRQAWDSPQGTVPRPGSLPPSAALNAPRTSRRPRRSVACGAGLPLAALRFSPPHKSPTPGTAHRAVTLMVLVDACHGGAGKAVVGCAPAATYAAPRSGGLRGLRVALRRRVGHTLFELRAQRRCASSVAPARGRVCVAALAARAPQGTLRAAEGAAFERRRIPGRGFATLSPRTGSASYAPWPAMDQ
ncbi:MAG: hypothetical protein LKCHEGNO_01411 [Burkholderiaceae bacterium]|nr:hypothetical protein [Burkholderiaceae bacterium]